ncbi:hypothetical protein KEM54_002108 [Ascosphaera aggregata]|nr:hypothetical protein KEM54_002108 [Ascosphaera aggregata]
MARAEVGSTKYISNKLKSKGLQRLRWYCQVCERQMRDENGFKCHTQSESHVRQLLLVGEDPKKYISQYSNEFLSDFIRLLRTAHGEKSVHINHFYQEYIANKEHVHMNATKWSSLTEFAKYLGKEGICRVEEGEKGLFISWIDNSPEALRRQDAIRKKERQDRGDEEREQKMIEAQIKRAQQDKEAAAAAAAAAAAGGGKRKYQEGADQGKEEQDDESRKMLKRAEGEEKIKLSFTPKVTAAATSGSYTHHTTIAKTSSSPIPPAEGSKSEQSLSLSASSSSSSSSLPTSTSTSTSTITTSAPPPGASFKMNITTAKPKNVFAAAAKKKKPVTSTSGATTTATTATTTGTRSAGTFKPLSATEKVIKEDMERKRKREARW